MMVDETVVATLLGAIYEAAADPSNWPKALTLLANSLGAPSAGIARQGRTPSECWSFSTQDPSFAEKCMLHDHQVNPIRQRAGSTPAGTVQTDAVVMARSGFPCTEFSNDFLCPAGVHAMLNCVALVEEGRQPVVTAQGSREFGPEHVRLQQFLAPHLQRAVQLNIKLAKLETNHAASVEALNRLDQGALLADAGGRVLFANRVAEDLFGAGRDLRLDNGVIHSRSAADTSRLRGLIEACARKGINAGKGGNLSLSRGRGKAPLSFLVVPLHYEMPFLMADGPAALILVTDPDREAKPLAAQIRAKFGLTTREAMFAAEIISGDSIQAAADRLKITRSTARTHLSRIFDKTGTRKQAELVRLLMQTARSA